MELFIAILLGLNNLIAANDPTNTDPAVYVGQGGNKVEVRAKNQDGHSNYVAVTENGEVKYCCIDDLP